MFGEGYVTFDGIDCVYIESKDKIKLIPKNADDLKKLNRHFDDHNFFFHYADPIDKNYIAYIEKTELSIRNSLSLIPRYSVERLNEAPISSLELTGPAIDEFFSPSGYYYCKHKAGVMTGIDLTIETELADKWKISVDDTLVDISLLYGGILQHGVASDLMLHPRLRAEFPPSIAPDYYYKIYSVLISFLQLVQYNGDLRNHRVYLRGEAPEYNSGYLHDWKARNDENCKYYTEAEYRYLKPYIQKLLQFSADSLNISLRFLPIAQYRYRGSDYHPDTLTSLFATFESEYKANSALYDQPNNSNIDNIKTSIIRKIKECQTTELTKEERAFLNQAEDRVNNLGVQTGQNRKIKNVCRVMEPAMKRSADYLFVRAKLGTSKNGFTSDEINQIAEKIVSLRAQASHEYSILEFDDGQAEYLRFLEVLVYAQILKRAGIDDAGIELIIGLIFHCNYVYMEDL